MEADLFRTASSGRVLRRMGSVFRDKEFSRADVFDGGYDTFGADAAADALYARSETSRRADAFISHAWGDDATLKWLALCYYANLRRAVIASFMMCFALIAGLMVWSGGDVTAYGGAWWLLPAFLAAPGATFLIAFFCGGGGQRWWVDKLCVHQRRAELRSAGIRGLPEHLARCDRLVVLHSAAYFSRLWTCYELATFLATTRADRIDVIPLWLPPLVLATMAADVIGAVIFYVVINRLIPPITAVLGPLLGIIVVMTLATGVAYALAAVPIVWAARVRERACRRALKQIRDFSLARASCCDEQDRPMIEGRVGALFGGDDPIGAFEAAVRSDVRREVVLQSGGPVRTGHMSFALAALPFLTMTWTFPANVLGCDGLACSEGARALGFDDVRWFLAAHALACLSALLCCLSVYPLIWRAVAAVEDALRPRWRPAATAAAVVVAYASWGFACGFGSLLIILAAALQDPRAFAVVGAWFAGLVAWNLYIFGAGPRPAAHRYARIDAVA